MCSIPLYMDYFDELCLKEHVKCNGRPQNQTGREMLLGLNYADDLSIVDKL